MYSFKAWNYSEGVNKQFKKNKSTNCNDKIRQHMIPMIMKMMSQPIAR